MMIDILFWIALIVTGFAVGGALIWIIDWMCAPIDRWIRRNIYR